MSTLMIGRVEMEVNSMRTIRGESTMELRGVYEPVGANLEQKLLQARETRFYLDQAADSREVVAITWDGLAYIDGFYVVSSVGLETVHQTGAFRFEIDLDYVGSEQDVKFESLITGRVLANDHGITDTLSEPFHAPPPHTTYDPAGTVPAYVTRNLESGLGLRVYRDVSMTANPKWGVKAADFYKGAAVIRRRSRITTDISKLGGGSMVLDLDASKITALGDSGKLASWPDQSGLGNHATQGTVANQPWFSTRDYWLRMTGVSGQAARTPDSTALSIIGDLTLIAEMEPDSWVAGGWALVGKWAVSGGTYALHMPTANGIPQLSWADILGVRHDRNATVALPFAGAERRWVAATLDVNNDAAGHTARFYWSLDGVTWTQLGDPVVTPGLTTIRDTADVVTVGALGNTSESWTFNGKAHYAEIRNGLASGVNLTGGTVVANPNFNVVNAAPFTDDFGNVWSLLGTATIEAGAYRTAEVRFNGLDEFLTLPNLMSAVAAGTIVALLKADVDPPFVGSQSGLWRFGTAGQDDHFPFTDGLIYDGFGSTTRKTTVNPVLNLASAYRAYGVRSAAADWKNYLDGDLLFTTATNNVAWVTAPTIGKSVSTAYFKGRIRRVVLYKAKLSDNDLLLAMSELMRAA